MDMLEGGLTSGGKDEAAFPSTDPAIGTEPCAFQSGGLNPQRSRGRESGGEERRQ